MTDDVRVEITAPLGRITLNRPNALNALDLAMFLSVEHTLDVWRTVPEVGLVVVRGSGRAFSAGGDIRAVRDAVLRGDGAYLQALYRSEYAMNAMVSEYPKPYVALVDGICMGGGMGLTVHGRYRVVTEKAVLAMPETAIGFFPDVGCTYVLPRLPGRVGWYLGLTGSRVDAADALWCGLATHVVPSDSLDGIEANLARGVPVDEALDAVALRAPHSSLAEKADAIARCFTGPTLRDVFETLAEDATPWAEETLATLRRMSPSALAATWELFERGSAMTLRQCLETEFLVGQQLLYAPDFSEGVRAVVIDKDRRAAWSPPSLDDAGIAAVTAMVDSCVRRAKAIYAYSSDPLIQMND